MPAFAIRTTESLVVADWLRLVGERLQGESFLNMYFRGAVRMLEAGVYVIDVQPVLPRLIVNMWAFFLSVGGCLAWYAGWATVSYIAISTAFFIAVCWNSAWSPGAYKLAIKVQVRRLTGEWHLVEDYTADVLGRLARGTA